MPERAGRHLKNASCACAGAQESREFPWRFSRARQRHQARRAISELNLHGNSFDLEIPTAQPDHADERVKDRVTAGLEGHGWIWSRGRLAADAWSTGGRGARSRRSFLRPSFAMTLTLFILLRRRSTSHTVLATRREAAARGGRAQGYTWATGGGAGRPA